jgi:DNA-binding PadR family transcriptional regulator
MAVREGLLAVLSGGPRHGYQIKTDFETLTGGVWRLNVGQVYTTLDRLERDGMVEMDDSGESKVYSLTTEGEDELARWWEAAPIDEAPPRDELMLKVLTALDRGADHALRVVDAHRTVLTSLLQQRRKRMREPGPLSDSLAAQLVGDALMLRAESDLRWLDQCEARLRATGAGKQRRGRSGS